MQDDIAAAVGCGLHYSCPEVPLTYFNDGGGGGSEGFLGSKILAKRILGGSVKDGRIFLAIVIKYQLKSTIT